MKVADTQAATGGGPAEAGVAAAALEGAMRALLREAELREEDSGMEEEDEENEEGDEEDDEDEEDEAEQVRGGARERFGSAWHA